VVCIGIGCRSKIKQGNLDFQSEHWLKPHMKYYDKSNNLILIDYQTLHVEKNMLIAAT
jgi:hypothetical protein